MPTIIGAFEVSEVSGAVPLGDGSLLLLSDEAGAFHVQDAAHLLASGRVEKKQARPLDGFAKIDDMEDASLDPRSGAVFIVTSHSRNKRGDVKKRRYRIVRAQIQDGEAKVEHDDWLLWAIMKRMPDLTPALMRTPAQGGLNIEGVVCTPDGELLVGLRSPTATLREVNREMPEVAQMLRITNPGAIWDEPKDKADAAQLKRRPLHLNLNGQGIRGLCRDEAGGYLILSNMAVDPNHQARSEWQVWRWSGDEAQAPQLCAIPAEVRAAVENPEAVTVVAIEGEPHVMLTGDEEGESPYALLPLDELKAEKEN